MTVNGANVTVPNFTATAQTWSITGSVGTTGSGATITLTGASTATTTANSSGAYTFTGLANGSYTVTPSLTGYTFSPASQAATVNGANVTVPNFTAAAAPSSITIDATVSEDRSTLSSSIVVSSLTTTSSNELILALISTGALTGGRRDPGHVMVTGVSGGGLTWELVNRTRAQTGTAEIWRAFAGAPLRAYPSRQRYPVMRRFYDRDELRGRQYDWHERLGSHRRDGERKRILGSAHARH